MIISKKERKLLRQGRTEKTLLILHISEVFSVTFQFIITLCFSPHLFQYLYSCQKRAEVDDCAWNYFFSPFGKDHHTLTTSGQEDKRRGSKNKSVKWNLGFQQPLESYCLPENLMPWVFTTGCYHLIMVTSSKPTVFLETIITSIVLFLFFLFVYCCCCCLSFFLHHKKQEWQQNIFLCHRKEAKENK